MKLKHLFLTTMLAGALSVGHAFAQDAGQHAGQNAQDAQQDAQTQGTQAQDAQPAQGGQENQQGAQAGGGQEGQPGQAAGQMAARDMSRLTCRELTGMVPAEALFTLFWIDGYLSGQAGDAVLEPETFMQHRDRIVQVCTAQDAGDRLVLEAVQQAR